MLKIKDDVDLKELEKFGFKTEDDDGFIWCEPNEDIVINPNGYILVYGNDEQGNCSMNALYDLIQARISRKNRRKEVWMKTDKIYIERKDLND